MKNPDLDYKAGLTELWSVTQITTDEVGGELFQFLGECTEKVINLLLIRSENVRFEIKPSRSVMTFTGQDVAGIGEPK